MQTIIIGYGNLGKIYAKTLLKSGMIQESELFILRKSLDDSENKIGNEFTASNLPTIKANLMIISVKPQDFETIIEVAKNLISKNTLVYSVMAGITIEKLQASLNCKKSNSRNAKFTN